MSKKITQRDRILQYLHDFGSITSWQAYADLGVTQLGARLQELEERGYVFTRENIPTKNRYGENTHYTRYALLQENQGGFIYGKF